MKILAERTIKFVNLEVNLENKEYAELLRHAKNNIPPEVLNEFLMTKLHPVLLAQGTLRFRGAGRRSEAKTLADPQGKRPVVSRRAPKGASLFTSWAINDIVRKYADGDALIVEKKKIKKPTKLKKK